MAASHHYIADAHTVLPTSTLITAMEATFDSPQSAPAVPTIPGHQEVEHEAIVTRGKSQPGTIGACDACRLRKVRCLANEDSRSSKCQRCARASRECVRSLPIQYRTAHVETRQPWGSAEANDFIGLHYAQQDPPPKKNGYKGKGA